MGVDGESVVVGVLKGRSIDVNVESEVVGVFRGGK